MVNFVYFSQSIFEPRHFYHCCKVIDSVKIYVCICMYVYLCCYLYLASDWLKEGHPRKFSENDSMLYISENPC